MLAGGHALTNEDESAKPTWEVLETTSSAVSFHSCDVEPNTSLEVLDTPEEATHMQDKLRWPYRAVSKGWQAMSWKWLEPDTGAVRVMRLCRLGRLLLTRWRSLCQPGMARPHHPGDGDHWHEDSEIEDVFRELRNMPEMDEQPARAERVRAGRRTPVRSKKQQIQEVLPALGRASWVAVDGP